MKFEPDDKAHFAAGDRVVAHEPGQHPVLGTVERLSRFAGHVRVQVAGEAGSRCILAKHLRNATAEATCPESEEVP